MLSRLSSWISTYVSPYATGALDYVRAHQVESLAVALGAVVLVLTVLVVAGSSWQPEPAADDDAVVDDAVEPDDDPADVLQAVDAADENEPVIAADVAEVFAQLADQPVAAAATVADDPVDAPEFEPVTAEIAAPAPVEPPVAPVVSRPILASVQDVLPGTPMRFAPEVELPGRPSGPAVRPADDDAARGGGVADEVDDTGAPTAPYLPVPEQRLEPAYESVAYEPAPQQPADELTPVPALFSAFAELSELSSRGRRAGDQEDGAA